MLKGKIQKFLPVCNRFCKALVDLGDHGNVYTIVPKVDGKPIFAKGEDVAYTPSPGRMFKGHYVHGSIAAIEDLVLDEEDLEASETWGLT